MLFRKLKFIPLSTCEAEIAALVSALKEAMFVLEILFDLGHEFDSVDGYTDSKSGYDTVLNPGDDQRSASVSTAKGSLTSTVATVATFVFVRCRGRLLFDTPILLLLFRKFEPRLLTIDGVVRALLSAACLR